jgi:hypothetical protein
VAEYEGREVTPQDNGYLSLNHAEYASTAERNRLLEFPGLRRKPLRASAGHPVTQLWYARQGIITPEMEFIAIRENMGRATMSDHSGRHSPQPLGQAARRLFAAGRERIHTLGFPSLSAAHSSRNHAGICPRVKLPPAARLFQQTSITPSWSR